MGTYNFGHWDIHTGNGTGTIVTGPKPIFTMTGEKGTYSFTVSGSVKGKSPTLSDSARRKYNNFGIATREKNSSGADIWYSTGGEGETAWVANASTYVSFSTTRSTTLTTSRYFNSSNPTVKSLTREIGFNGCDLYNTEAGSNSIRNQNYSYTVIGNFTLVLNVPPTFTKSAMTFDTPWIYTGLTNASVDVDNLEAYYGGYITEAKLTIGNRSVVLTGDATNTLSGGTLSMRLEEVGTFTPTITVTDSRGQTKTESLAPITVLGYVAPSANLSVQRTLNTGVPADEGTCAVVTARFTFTDAIATLEEPTVLASGLPSVTATWYTARDSQTGAIDLTSEVDWSDTSGISSGDTLYGLVGTFQPNESYVINVTPIDSQGTGTPMSITLPTAFYTIDFLAGGHGIAFGKPATQSDVFECDLDAQFNKESYFKDGTGLMRALFDFVRPVGSAYSTVDPTFDPNNVWGGTWEKLPEGYILLSGSDNGSYVVGDDTSTGSGYKEYGSNTHTLTLDEIPSHNHNSKTLTGTMRVMAWYNTTVSGIVSVSNKSANKNPSNGTNEGACTYTVNATHTHDSQGGGHAHSIMQKSIAVYWWIRTA